MAERSLETSGGILVGDQRKDQLLLLMDHNGDGKAFDEGEAIVFFDANNNSGLTAPTNDVFSIHQSKDKSVYFGDGDADTIYKLNDLNGDGDAQDPGEAHVWFSEDNAMGLPIVTPNGVHEGSDGAIYVVNAGVPSIPLDAIYRTLDLNGDGDANDADEASLWLDLSSVIDPAVPFDLSFDGGVAYLCNITEDFREAIYKIEDQNNDGLIQNGEVAALFSSDISIDTQMNIANAVSTNGTLYALTWPPDASDMIRLYQLKDMDSSGQIDSAEELVEIWNGGSMVDGLKAEIGFSIAANFDGSLSITANSFSGGANVLRLKDVNKDGDYQDSGETEIFGSASYQDQLAKPRAVEFYNRVEQLVASNKGTVVNLSADQSEYLLNVHETKGEMHIRSQDECASFGLELTLMMCASAILKSLL